MKQILSAKNIFTIVLMLGMSGCATKPVDDGQTPAKQPVPQLSESATNATANPELAPLPVEPAGPLTLRSALALSLTENPELAPFSWQERADEARVLQAGLRKNPELGLEVEDILGTGIFNGAEEAQITLQLSQVIELGGKRAARTEVASQARGITLSDYELKRVEVLGEVTRRFIQVVANQHYLELASQNLELAKATLRTVGERVKAGKGSALEEQKALVAVARGELLVEGAEHELRASRKKLAASWRNRQPVFERAEADLFARKLVPTYEELAIRIAGSPEIARWASEKKLRDAEIKLADAQRVPNLTVGGGIRRFQGFDDEAFVFGLSVPLQIFDRNQGSMSEARSLLRRTEADQRAAEIRLATVMLGLYEEMIHEGHIMEGLQKSVLPQAAVALEISTEGFNRGRFSYLEVIDAQRTIFEVKQEHIRAATSYHQFIVEIERLIGQPIEDGGTQRQSNDLQTLRN